MTKWIAMMMALWAGTALAQQAAVPSSPQAPRPIGVVTQIETGSLTLRTDAGPELQVPLPEGVSVVRVPPGATDLKSATAISVGEIVVGDRVLVRGRVSDDHKSVAATSIIVMAKTELEKAREAERAEWRQRGIGGVVIEVHPDSKEISISVPNIPPTPGNLTHPVTITLSANTELLHYAPNSIKFSDARPCTLQDIKVGDQVRALGKKSEDGSRYAAEKLIAGSFRMLSATVISVDAPGNAVTVKDLVSGQPVLVKTNGDSRLRRLPPFLAQLISRFSSAGEQGEAAAAGAPAGGTASGGPGGQRRERAFAGGASGRAPSGGPGAGRGNGPPDFQQMLERAPAFSLSELKPEDALIVLSTEGVKSGEVTAITVLAGVEPILEAQPTGGEQMVLGPWNMGGGGEGAD